uniref:Actin binding Rho activating protein b n=1 Tax=Oncorhynchus kisutch TaxID=8019 RepID=A0A8C7L5I4_ONCKI
RAAKKPLLSRKNIRDRLIFCKRPICMVSNLTRSWQKWVSEIKDKLAKEPISWAPDPLRELWGKPPKTPSTTKLGTWQKRSLGRQRSLVVVKTVTSGVQERSVGTTFLTELICMEAPPPGEEIDRTLSKRGSLTLHRKCSKRNVTRIWRWTQRKAGTLRSKKELDDANRINALSKKYSAVGNLKSRWQNWSSTNTVNQKLNPFSEDFDYEYSMSLRLHKGRGGLRTPQGGHQNKQTMNDPDPDGKTHVTFRELFDRYVRVSDKVVGILLRVKAWEGEVWNHQDSS